MYTSAGHLKLGGRCDFTEPLKIHTICIEGDASDHELKGRKGKERKEKEVKLAFHLINWTQANPPHATSFTTQL